MRAMTKQLLFSLIFLVGLCAVSHADVTIGNATTFTDNSPATGALDCGAGSDRFLAVGIMDTNGIDQITAVTYNSVSLTQLDTQSVIGLWYLKAPASGSNTISATADSGGIVVVAICYSSVDQTTSLGTQAKDTVTDGTSVNVTGVAGGIVMDIARSGYGTLVPGGGQTTQASSGDVSFRTTTKTGTGTVNMTEDADPHGGNSVDTIAVPILPSTAAAAVKRKGRGPF
jgi:hypothetical protein